MNANETLNDNFSYKFFKNGKNSFYGPAGSHEETADKYGDKYETVTQSSYDLYEPFNEVGYGHQYDLDLFSNNNKNYQIDDGYNKCNGYYYSFFMKLELN